jgi:ATP-dependent RNA helicase RhlE
MRVFACAPHALEIIVSHQESVAQHDSVPVHTFASLGISDALLKVLEAEKYSTPTPIQMQAIPALLEGKDVLGLAQTGTGKTAAFGLPLLQKLAQEAKPAALHTARALILAPTRELAVQIDQALRVYGRGLKLRHGVIVGGVGQGGQINMLSRGVDVLVATPGRLLDLIKQRQLRLDHTTTFIVDEADRMFDMGFIKDVRRIAAMLPKERQSMLFSATMPGDVVHLVDEMLKSPLRISISPKTPAVDRIEQSVWFVDARHKRALLRQIVGDEALSRVIIFTRTKHGANKVAELLDKSGVRSDAIHGNKSQNARQRALESFRNGRIRALVATDIAARGIDIDGVSHVINYELPNVAESYVHRIGRTARAGAQGIAISFCDGSERPFLRDIERMTRRKLTIAGDYQPTGEAIEDAREAPRSERAEQRPAQPHRHGQKPKFGRKPGGQKPGGKPGGHKFGGGKPHAQGPSKPGDHKPGEHKAGEHRSGEHKGNARGPKSGKRPFHKNRSKAGHNTRAA